MTEAAGRPGVVEGAGGLAVAGGCSDLLCVSAPSPRWGRALGDLLISTGWLEIEHAQMLEQIKDDEEPAPDVLDDVMAVLSAAKEMVAETPNLLVRAEGHVVSLMAAKAKRDTARGNDGASDDR